MRLLLLQQKFNQHDQNHQPGCFKKGPECRRNFGKQSCKSTTLGIEEELEDGSNITTWHRLNANSNVEPITSTPYLIQTKRPMGCQFLNTHSVPASEVFACNTNVQLGEPCHLFYTTCYAFKSTQKDDADRFVIIGTKVIRPLIRMRSIAQQNAALQSTKNDDSVSENTNREVRWSESLSRLL
jgi:hypothetical protein